MQTRRPTPQAGRRSTERDVYKEDFGKNLMQPAPNARTRVARLARTLAREPLGVFAALWPLVLLAPFVPGIPQPAVAAPEWRQELALSALVSITLIVCARLLRARAPLTVARLTPTRDEVSTLLPLALF